LPTRISRDFEFLAAVHFEGNFIMNQYSLTLSLDVNVDAIKEQNIAMDRIKYLIYEILDSAVFVGKDEAESAQRYQDAGLKVCVLPEEPYDQIITILLFHKINAICEDKLVLTHLQLNSMLSDEVGFMIDGEEADELQPAFKHGWWVENSTAIAGKFATTKREKVVKLVKKSDWGSVGLDWEEKESSNAEIIFAPEFDK
jgi:hypothetical protein